MSSATERPATAAPARAGRWFSSPRLLLPTLAGAAVFLVNNLLLARLLTALPGGTALAPTTMLAVGWVALRLRRFGAVTVLYATYGFLGTLGHLGVDAGSYVLHLPRLLGAAVLFDGVLVLARFRRWSVLAGLLPCAAVLLAGTLRPPLDWLIALGLGWAGLGAGMLAHAWPGSRQPTAD